MESAIFGECVKGASHKRTNTPCQDWRSNDNELVLSDGTIIIAVADGHGDKDCLHSHIGSRKAVEAFCDVMKYYHNHSKNNPEKFMTFLKKQGEEEVSQAIEKTWKKLVIKAHEGSKRDMPESVDKDTGEAIIYKQYGTTLVGLLIASSFIFAYQLGDGDITFIDNTNKPKKVLDGDKFLGTDTYSLSGKESWRQAVTCVQRKDSILTLPHMYLLSTDGFANSHKNEEEYFKTCVDYFRMVNEHGADVVKSNLNKWLDETSEQGCGDDITLLMAYFYESPGEVNVSVSLDNNLIEVPRSEVAEYE